MKAAGSRAAGSGVLVLRASGAAGARRLESVSPNRWRGECGCAVGPFSSRQVAEIFGRFAVLRGHCRRPQLRVFPYRDAWYVEVRADA